MLTTEAGVHELEVLWHHFASADDGVAFAASHEESVASTVDCALEMAARLWWRLVLFFSTWPWPLLRIVAPALSHAEQLAVGHEVFAAEECCLDAGCTRKARNLYPNA